LLAEGREADLLCFNSLIPFLANLLSIHAFRDYGTTEELLEIVPLGHCISLEIPRRVDLLEKPFFLSPTRVGNIETAGEMANWVFVLVYMSLQCGF
jgi:hypothetical protein